MNNLKIVLTGMISATPENWHLKRIAAEKDKMIKPMIIYNKYKNHSRIPEKSRNHSVYYIKTILYNTAKEKKIAKNII